MAVDLYRQTYPQHFFDDEKNNIFRIALGDPADPVRGDDVETMLIC